MVISIGTSKFIDFIRDKLIDDFKLSQAEDVNIHIDFIEKEMGKYTFFCFDITKNYQYYYYKVAKVLTEIIIDRWSKHIIEHNVGLKYYYFDKLDREDISERAEKIVATDKIINREEIFFKVLDYIQDEEDNILIDGFVNFRLKGFVNSLKDCIEYSVDDFLMEKEYNEFIALLKYFVEIQIPKVEKVHLLLKSASEFLLYDEDRNIIENDFEDSYVMDLVNEDINYEDLLISTLITIAPCQIILHVIDETKVENIVKTITSVFGKKVTFCHGCEFCLNYMQNNNN